MFKLIGPIMKVLQQGETLKNPEQWKQGATLTSACLAVIYALVAVVKYFYPELVITEEQIVRAGEILSGVLILVGGFTHVATNKEKGFKPKEKTE